MISEVELTFNFILVAGVQHSDPTTLDIALIIVSATKRNLEGSGNYNSENPVPSSWPVSVEEFSLSLLNISQRDNFSLG